MSHPPNRTNLPPAKSAEEYEREIASLRGELATALHHAWVSAYSIGWADKGAGLKHGHTPNPHAAAALGAPPD